MVDRVVDQLIPRRHCEYLAIVLVFALLLDQNVDVCQRLTVIEFFRAVTKMQWAILVTECSGHFDWYPVVHRVSQEVNLIYRQTVLFTVGDNEEESRTNRK